MNDSISTKDAGAGEAAVDAPLTPDCPLIAAAVPSPRGTKSRVLFSSILGCTDSTGSVQEHMGRPGAQSFSPAPRRPWSQPVVGSKLTQSHAPLHLYFVVSATTGAFGHCPGARSRHAGPIDVRMTSVRPHLRAS